MILLPAIDIRGGKAVRLQRGDFDNETVYVDDPLEAARSFVDAGARFLHVVDLDGAREGKPANLDHLGRITRELDGVAGVADVDELDPLDHPALVDVEAGNDPSQQSHRLSASSSTASPTSIRPS